ncbi:bifunctional 4-hydroxy-2-oxoglutarate aldolase/2-dehydro-3-deoxy-phosphogluconate aldolase [Kineosporia sp. A_224]|uniref:bifunctional 4-hydroxy-2-oxoglutarate aldolase/2-dehydro-3-deoxy-phosphogluconate aldolase n=1 Tax=Kineosporia sp. A_224 TaxID=1962180 RepID=UPI0018E9B958|nr:bifunctional 4-hydroxy-2-oxoglutarate aldolase/2-dehydro-3-deoxy-phosphogluconate aldolase [Kineosporia sp. A_224]
MPEGSEQLVLDGLRHVGVVPVVTVTDAATAPELVGALAAAGLRYVEITLRTPAALDALAAARSAGVLGAGTVTTVRDAESVLEAGVRFVVSPGLDEGVVRICQEAGVPVLPGVATPTEVMAARALGLRWVKVFPVAHLGGAGFVRALSSVWPDMTFLPTGGVSRDNAREYLDIPAVAAIGGSWMVPAGLVAAHDWPRIGQLARDAAELRSFS